MNTEKIVGRIELRGGDIFFNGYPQQKEKFLDLLKKALNHNIVFQNGSNMRFCIETSFGHLIASFPAAAPCSLDYLWSHLKERLKEDGPVATLHQDEFYIKQSN